MRFSDICIITENVPLLTRFYEDVLEVNADGDAVHTALNIGDARIAIYSKKAAAEEMSFDFSKFQLHILGVQGLFTLEIQMVI